VKTGLRSLPRYYQSINFLKGNLGKEVVKSLLERSGYTVCSYGYEVTLLDAMSKRTPKKSNSPTGIRLRKSPDLLVYDDKTIMLVEVKTRGKIPSLQDGLVWIGSNELELLKEFWKDSILAIVVPEGFYAQRIIELEIQQNGYQRLSDFKKFQDIFTRVNSEDISYYEDIALQILRIFMSERAKEALENAPKT
jgi:hypothetical protein